LSWSAETEIFRRVLVLVVVVVVVIVIFTRVLISSGAAPSGRLRLSCFRVGNGRKEGGRGASGRGVGQELSSVVCEVVDDVGYRYDDVPL
jgi:hypothetical protein